jgi:hypothetical protein
LREKKTRIFLREGLDRRFGDLPGGQPFEAHRHAAEGVLIEPQQPQDNTRMIELDVCS